MIEELKVEARELGITFNPQIGEAKLKEKIDAFYASRETDTIEEVIAKKEAENKAPTIKTRTKGERIRDAKAAASIPQVVTITDNDQRENNQTTMAVVNCSNGLFDLGTVKIPLDMPVEVLTGHIDVLNEIRIPHHTKDSRTGLGKTVTRKRYSIHYEK